MAYASCRVQHLEDGTVRPTCLKLRASARDIEAKVEVLERRSCRNAVSKQHRHDREILLRAQAKGVEVLPGTFGSGSRAYQLRRLAYTLAHCFRPR